MERLRICYSPGRTRVPGWNESLEMRLIKETKQWFSELEKTLPPLMGNSCLAATEQKDKSNRRTGPSGLPGSPTDLQMV